MPDAIQEIDRAISELDTLRAALNKRTAKQISSREERDLLNAIALSWFRSRKPLIQQYHGSVSLDEIDQPYQTLLDGSGRNPLRTTTKTAVRNAKRNLRKIRPVLAQAAPALTKHSSDQAPDFSMIIADSTMRGILIERWEECQRCIHADAPLAACVMMGGLLEALLLSRVNGLSDKSPAFTSPHAPTDKNGKTRPLKEWTLKAYLDVGHDLNWITQSAKDVGDVIRDYRNYVHPQKQLTSSLTLSKQDAELFWEVVKAIARQVTTP